jgi:hypothetical protein
MGDEGLPEMVKTRNIEMEELVHVSDVNCNVEFPRCGHLDLLAVFQRDRGNLRGSAGIRIIQIGR